MNLAKIKNIIVFKKDVVEGYVLNVRVIMYIISLMMFMNIQMN